jgi:hypothetical protein
MRWRAAHATEVIRRVAQAASEMIVPHTIRDAAPGERVLLIGDPVRERRTALGFIAGMGLM